MFNFGNLGPRYGCCLIIFNFYRHPENTLVNSLLRFICIEKLKEKMGAKTKIDVVRTALKLLEADVLKTERIKRWEKAAKVISKSGLDVLKDFQTADRFKKLP